MGLKRFSFRKASSSLRRGEALGEVRLERGLSAAGSWSCWSLRFMSVQAFASRSGSTARGVSVAGLTAAEIKAHSVCRREGGRAGGTSRGAARKNAQH